MLSNRQHIVLAIVNTMGGGGGGGGGGRERGIGMIECLVTIICTLGFFNRVTDFVSQLFNLFIYLGEGGGGGDTK